MSNDKPDVEQQRLEFEAQLEGKVLYKNTFTIWDGEKYVFRNGRLTHKPLMQLLYEVWCLGRCRPCHDLAESIGLLSEWRQGCSQTLKDCAMLIRRTDDFLASPSAPAAKCEACEGTGHDLNGEMNPQGGAADCIECSGRGTV